jgi:hypothetical protein
LLGLLGSLYAVKIIFTLLGCLITYALAERIMQRSGFFAMALYAISNVALFNEAINLWKGEAFSLTHLASETSDFSLRRRGEFNYS